METTLSRKADTAVYVDEDDDRFEAALRLAEDDPARGAEALRSIVADHGFDPDTRLADTAQLCIAAGTPEAGVTGGITIRNARSTP